MKIHNSSGKLIFHFFRELTASETFFLKISPGIFLCFTAIFLKILNGDKKFHGEK